MGGYYYYLKSEQRLNIQCHNIGIGKLDSFIKRLDKYVNISKGLDVVHINSPNDPLTSKLLIVGSPKIFTFHGSLDVPSINNSCRLLQEIFSKVDALVVASNHAAKTIQEACGFKPAVIHHGVDFSLFNPSIISRSKARRKLKIPYQKRIILWSARISPEKKLETLLLALPRVLKSHNDLLVVIKGRAANTGYLLKIKTYIKKLNLGKYIKLDLSWAPFIKMPLYYRASDIFVNTSITEAFGSLTMLEAMACGLPVIGNDASSIPEAIGNAGLLYDGTSKDLAEKILEVIYNDKLLNNLGNLAYKRIQDNFRLDITAKKYLYTYNKLQGAS
jgi:glycosyltransferase involved in cell wall biosynthesis